MFLHISIKNGSDARDEAERRQKPSFCRLNELSDVKVLPIQSVCMHFKQQVGIEDDLGPSRL